MEKANLLYESPLETIDEILYLRDALESNNFNKTI